MNILLKGTTISHNSGLLSLSLLSHLLAWVRVGLRAVFFLFFLEEEEGCIFSPQVHFWIIAALQQLASLVSLFPGF